MKRFKKFTMIFRGGIIGMCLEYHYRMKPDHNYAIIVGGIMIIIAIIDIFNDDY